MALADDHLSGFVHDIVSIGLEEGHNFHGQQNFKDEGGGPQDPSLTDSLGPHRVSPCSHLYHDSPAQTRPSMTHLEAFTPISAQAARAVEADASHMNLAFLMMLIQQNFELFDDEAYAGSSTSGYVTSIASDISRGVIENDRIYHAFGNQPYGLPMDEYEKDRMDLQHHKYSLLMGDRLFHAPVPANPQKILDLGAGTGIWALDVADLYPMAEAGDWNRHHSNPTKMVSTSWCALIIKSTDYAGVAPNCNFEIDDLEDEWTWRKDSFDFIHFRDPIYCIRGWPKLFKQAYEHLKPGGLAEFSCIYPRVMCDDGTMPPDSGFALVCNKIIEASIEWKASAEPPLYFAFQMQDAGFAEVSENIFKVPSNPWSRDQRLKKIGHPEMINVTEGAGAFGLRVFSEAFNWSNETIETYLALWRHDVKNTSYHQYCGL